MQFFSFPNSLEPWRKTNLIFQQDFGLTECYIIILFAFENEPYFYVCSLILYVSAKTL